MEKEREWREFVALSEKDQQRVADFIFSLREENATSDSKDEEPPSLK